MKLKSILVIFLLSLFFLGIQSNSFEIPDNSSMVYDTSVEISEKIEEIKDNRSLFSYIILESSTIVCDLSFFPNNYFIKIHKPPILS